jgi:hypothetical protein
MGASTLLLLLLLLQAFLSKHTVMVVQYRSAPAGPAAAATPTAMPAGFNICRPSAAAAVASLHLFAPCDRARCFLLPAGDSLQQHLPPPAAAASQPNCHAHRLQHLSDICCCCCCCCQSLKLTSRRIP